MHTKWMCNAYWKILLRLPDDKAHQITNSNRSPAMNRINKIIAEKSVQVGSFRICYSY